VRLKLALALTLLLLAAGLWLFYKAAYVATRGGEDTPLYSAERHDPYGTAALKDLMAERGASVTLLRRPTPEEGTGAILIQALTSDRDSSTLPQRQTQRLKDWISQGNTLIQFTRVQTSLMTDCDVTVPTPVENLKEIQEAETHGKPQIEVPAQLQNVRWIAAPAGKGATALPKRLMLEFYSAAVLVQDAGQNEWHPLATKGDNEWVAATRSVGKGRLIVVGTPTPILNGTLGAASNMEFVLALLKPAEAGGAQEVLFDEWSHGLGNQRTIIGFIKEVGLLPVLLQLFFVVALYVWATSGVSQADPPGAHRRRSSSEQIDTLGHLYRQAMKPDLVFARVYAEVRNRLAGVLRCSPAGIEQALDKASPQVAGRARNILEHLHAIGRGRGPTCPNCGYDLTRNVTGECPECGAEISWMLKDRIASAAALADVPERQKQSRKADLQLAAALRESHLFVEEFARGRKRRD
jgi:hypothetical protein